VARRSWTNGELVAGVRSGDRRALARAISMVENREPGAGDVVRELYPSTGRAASIGVTGPPGVGKSSLVAALVRHVRGRDGATVGVVSVDPSSPFSHGALLGDRIRLAEHFLDPGVFIRSMGTRGHLGGLAEATLQALLLLDAFGKDVVFLETVGTGQSEVEVIGIADVVVLVLMPGSGDSVQALKAGIMEIPDVIAINKRDHPGANAMLNEVRGVVALDPDVDRRPPIVLTDAIGGEGVAELAAALDTRRRLLASSGVLEERRATNLEGEVLAVASARVRERLEHELATSAELKSSLESVARRELDPLSAVDTLLASALGWNDGATRSS
jgi:GTPase